MSKAKSKSKKKVKTKPSSKIFSIVFSISIICVSLWGYFFVYNPKEKSYINGSIYAYSILQKEITEMYIANKYVFNPENKNDTEFCDTLASKYGKNKSGFCQNVNPTMPQENFIFKNKKISVYGLEKPLYKLHGSYVKDIIIDTNTEKKGENEVGIDRLILRIYSSGRTAATLTPVNCSRQDEKDYGFLYSPYCIGSQEIDYLLTNRPLSFRIQQIGGDNGKTKLVSGNASFVWSDCRAFGGILTASDDYCEGKMLEVVKSCDEDYFCNIVLAK